MVRLSKGTCGFFHSVWHISDCRVLCFPLKVTGSSVLFAFTWMLFCTLVRPECSVWTATTKLINCRNLWLERRHCLCKQKSFSCCVLSLCFKPQKLSQLWCVKLQLPNPRTQGRREEALWIVSNQRRGCPPPTTTRIRIPVQTHSMTRPVPVIEIWI